MHRENPLPRWARQILIGVGLFLSGAILAFGYSYRPLHGALSWQVDQLEARLDERNRENLRLSDQLAEHTSVESNRIDPETLAQVERELEQTKRVLDQAERDLRRAEGKRKTANANASNWQQRFKELEARPAPVAAVSPAASSTKGRTGKPPASPSPEPPDVGSSGTSSSKAPEPSGEAATSPADQSPTTRERGIIPTEVATESKAP
jgi:septal ring factor EnvC (AmiA/AmiB activator)